jgi:hypothetical protein
MTATDQEATSAVPPQVSALHAATEIGAGAREASAALSGRIGTCEPEWIRALEFCQPGASYRVSTTPTRSEPMIRRPMPWPDGAKVAVAITFDMDADSLVHIAHPRDSITRVSTVSMLRYGPEVAVPRILDGYRRLGLKQTFFVPAWCIEQYPGPSRR